LEDGIIGGLTIGGLPPLTLLVDDFLVLSTPTSEEAFLLFPNILIILPAKLPASLAAGVGGTADPDFVLEGGLNFLSFYEN